MLNCNIYYIDEVVSGKKEMTPLAFEPIEEITEYLKKSLTKNFEVFTVGDYGFRIKFQFTDKRYVLEGSWFSGRLNFKVSN